MYFVIFEATPFEGKEKLAEQFYISLLPHLNGKFKGNGFHHDTFCLAVNKRRSVNVAVWDDAAAAWRWRMEENHLRLQKKGNEIVYESYRIRLGPDSLEGNEVSNGAPRHYTTLLYRATGSVEGKPYDDITSLLIGEVASQLTSEVVDSTVYQGGQTLWVTTWRSEDAAIRFEESLKPLPDDNLIRVRVDRDYTKLEREDAPHETAGMS